MKFKIPFLITLGIIILVTGVCTIIGCSKSNDSNSTPPVTNSGKGKVNDSGLPPDPGKAGEVTLAGIDSDNDGVRDDVQRYIALTYPKSEKTRDALFQYAKVREASLIDAKNKEKSIQHFEGILHSMECIAYIEVVSGGGHKNVEKKLDSVILNTNKRNNAYFDYLEIVGSPVIPATPYDKWASTCKFNVDPASSSNLN